MNISFRNSIWRIFLVLVAVVAAANVAYGFKERGVRNDIEKAEFRAEELYISQGTTPLADVIAQLKNRADWENFLRTDSGIYVYIDARSGRPTTIINAIPIIPGTGVSNRVTLRDISMKLGYEVAKIGEKEIQQIATNFLSEKANLLGINTAEIGKINVINQEDGSIWSIFITRQVKGIPVRDANIVMVINHGNLILWGVEKWGDIDVKAEPTITKEAAIAQGFALVGGQLDKDKFFKEVHLELVPTSPSSYTGIVGTGYKYHLVWAYTFRRDSYPNTWETLVDAHNGKVIAFQDLNAYALRKIVGSAYPLSNDNCSPQGVAYNAPMSYADTGVAAPNNYASINGLYDWTSGTATTTLTGRYVDLTDTCGAISESSTTGNIDMRGTNGDHDCTIPTGHSLGDTASSRSAGSEVPQINRQAASWIGYAWVNTSLPCNVNLLSTCNAFWDGTSINFYQSGGGCGNTGEIAAVFDHEWAHGIDANDGSGASNPGEVLADTLANQRLHTSCTGEGFFVTAGTGCTPWTCPSSGIVAGNNCSGYGDCCTGCTGIRDADYAKHASGNPHTPANFICALCGGGGGPCAKEVHCENAPGAEAMWDMQARDMMAAPFNYDKATAFQIGDRIIYLGSAAVTSWYTCTCPSTSGGCGATNGYMQFIARDDDDGNTSNGTPHMTAIANAFTRHGIGCAAPTPTNSGCATGPTAAPVLTVAATSNGASLSWTSVPNTSSYYIFKSMGPLGCDLGKVRVATSAGLTYTDQAMDCNGNYYSVIPVGSNAACIGKMSNCAGVVPPVGSPTGVTATATAPNQVTVSWNTVPSATGYNVYRKYTVCGTEQDVKIAGPIITTSYIDNSVSGGVTYQYSVNATSSTCGEHAKSPYVPVVPTGDCALTPCFAGVISAVNNKTSGCSVTMSWGTGTSSCGGFPTIKYNIYRSTDPAFVPSPANLLTTCQTSSSYNDTSANDGITYYYIVRAEDSRTAGSGPCNGGNTDSNLIRVNATPTGPETTFYSDNFEGATGWTHSAPDSTCTTGNWIVGDPEYVLDTGVVTQLEDDFTPAPGINAFFTAHNTSAGIDDVDGGVCTGLSPIIDASAYSRVRAVVRYYYGTRDNGDDPTGDYFRISLSNDGGATYPISIVNLGDITSQAVWTEASTLVSSPAQLRFRIQASDGAPEGDLIEGGLDEVEIRSVAVCTTGGLPPGTILNNLAISKSGANLLLNWTAPANPCVTANYGIYRGTLPWTSYNHTQVTCNTGGNTYTVPADTGSYYFLVVAQNSGNEGSYGLNSSGSQIPAASSPCLPQQIGTCN